MAFRDWISSIVVLFIMTSCSGQSKKRAYEEVNYHQESFILFEFLKYYKKDFGRFPNELEELRKLFENPKTDYSGVNQSNIKSNITDPFSGNDYKYVLISDISFILYSVGPDGVDDNSDIVKGLAGFTFKHFDVNTGNGDILIYHMENGKIINDFTNIEELF